MASPNAAYRSNSVSFGSFTAVILRPTDPLNPTTSPTTTLGTYIVESATLTHEGILGERPAVDGGDNGFWLVKGKITGSATIQIATSVTPALETGDFFTISTDANGEIIEADASGVVVTHTAVIYSPSLTRSTTDYAKISCSIIVDQFV